MRFRLRTLLIVLASWAAAAGGELVGLAGMAGPACCC